MIFSINTRSDISKLFYIISRSVRRVEFGAILKYHEWYVFMPNITYNSCCYLFILLPGKFSHLTPCVSFRQVASLHRRANWFWSPCLLVLKSLFSSWSRHWARSMYLSQYFGFPNFPLVPESPRNLSTTLAWLVWQDYLVILGYHSNSNFYM